MEQLSNIIISRFKNKKIVILGFEIEGISVCEFLMHSSSEIVVLDEKKRADFDEKELKSYENREIEFRLGKIEDLRGFDVVFRSPSFHTSLSYIEAAKKEGVEITSATKLFFDLCPCPIIGVTGTKGKGTTATLIHKMLKKEGFDAHLGGNIGTSPLSFLNELKPDSKVVLELSSFQLIDLAKSPHVAVMLMTTSEHLDYHADLLEYIEAKRNIFRFQSSSDFAIVNRDYPASNESDIHTEGKVYRVSCEQEIDRGCFVKNGGIYLKMDGHDLEIIKTNEVALIGKHNWENVQAAIVAALCSGATMKSILPVLKTFKGLPHRIEFVDLKRGVAYYDDSFSTTPETAIAAIEAFDAPKILILGGSSKNSDFTELGKAISDSNSIKAIIGIGEEWEQIKTRIMNYESRIKVYEGLKNMEEIVQKCTGIGEIGDVVLLSPACASFDMFQDYKDRGEQFKKEVMNLKH